MRPLKILMFVEASSVMGAAKSILSFCETATSLASEADPVEISVATFQRSVSQANVPPNGFLAAARRQGVTVHTIPERHRFDRALLKSVTDIVRQLSPDIVQTNNVKSHFLARAAGIQKHNHWIAFHHGYTATDLKMRCYNQLDRWSLRSAERVITVCRVFGRKLVSSGVPIERLRIVPNSGSPMPTLPEAELERLRSRLGVSQNTVVMLSIGRLSREKGHADLIEAAHWLRRIRPELPFKFILVGSGPELRRLEAKTDRLNLRSHVIFACREPDVLPFLRIADVFALPSHTEGSPHVILEAMATELPIVATRVGGIPELLQDGQTAILTDPRNPEQFALGIARMLNSKNDARRYAQSASQVLRQQFSPRMSALSLLAIYREVLRPDSLKASNPGSFSGLDHDLAHPGDHVGQVVV
jgi:glycosyltransferase involved in cell wall biosynthesis